MKSGYQLLIIAILLQSTLAFARTRQGQLTLEKNMVGAKGSASYLIDSKGLLKVSGSARAWMFGRHKFNEIYHVEVDKLSSRQFSKLNRSVVFDKLQLNVTHLDLNRGISVAQGDTKNGKVIFTFDISGPTIDILGIAFTVRNLPITFKLVKT